MYSKALPFKVLEESRSVMLKGIGSPEDVSFLKAYKIKPVRSVHAQMFPE
jgi:hypothetical protein